MLKRLINTPAVIAALKTESKQPRAYILVVFAIVYSLISLVNHYNYRTSAFDLGIYSNCLYQYAHLHKNHYPYLHYMFTNALADHFSLYTVFLAPLYYIFDTPTLLYVQILSVLFGAVGIYKIVQRKYNVGYLPEIAMGHYLSFFGIFSALSFDYHDNVVSAMLVPWFIYYFDSGKTKLTILFAVLIVVGKENMPIWLAFICFGLFALNYNDKAKRNFALLLAGASIIYTVVIIKIVMPGIDPMVAKNGYNAFQYSVLGKDTKDVVFNLLHHPLTIIKAFFVSPILDYPETRLIKAELYFCLLFSGGFMLLVKPQYLIMLIPIIAQKVLNNDCGKWGINAHYSIELVPIVILAFYEGLNYLTNAKNKLIIAGCVCVATLVVTIDKIERRYSIYYIRDFSAFYSANHYTCYFDKTEVQRVINLIPSNANLSVSTHFAPHVSFRKNVYQYPDVHDAQYIFVANSPLSYPIRQPEMEIKIKELCQSPQWETISKQKGIYLFKKK